MDSLPVFVGTSWAEHVSAWRSVTREIEERQWLLGAIADSLTRTYGESSIERFALEVGCKPQTVYQYAQVYERFRNSERSENLSWSHHLVASYSADPQGALEEAEAKNLSVQGLRVVVRAEEQRQALTAPDVVDELRKVGKFRAILFKCIVVDPPWEYDDQGSRISAGRHYDTLSLDVLRSLPVGELAAPDGCHLYLWVTNSFIRAGLELVEAWGFEEKTMITWVKESSNGKLQIGMGHYWRNVTDHLLFAVRGNMPTLRSDQPNLLFASRNRHSEKPASIYRTIERMSPPPYLDLFSRRKRRGWTVWGNEVENQK